MKAQKSKVRVLGENEGSVCEVNVDGRKQEHASKLKYLESVLDECCWKVVSTIKLLANPKGFTTCMCNDDVWGPP